MTKAEEILSNYPSVKLGLDEHYGKQTVLNALNEALRIHDVSRQSELLCDFLEWYDVDLTLEEREMQIKTYMDMKSHNCY